MDPSIRYVIFRILRYRDTVLVLDMGKLKKSNEIYITYVMFKYLFWKLKYKIEKKVGREKYMAGLVVCQLKNIK